MTKSATTNEAFKTRPLNRFSPLDNQPKLVAAPGKPIPTALRRQLRVRSAVLKSVLNLARDPRSVGASTLAGQPPISTSAQGSLRRLVLTDDDPRLVIVSVEPDSGSIMSGKSFVLRMEYVAGGAASPCLVSVIVSWAGEPFVVEQKLTRRELREGTVRIKFGRYQRLPAGPATFHVSLFGRNGAQAKHRTTCYVLPSNPLSLGLSPTTAFVTGTHSLRGRYDADDRYRTFVRLTVSNGNGSSVSMSRDIDWAFWNGGVGGTRVESGTHRWNTAISIPALGTWSGTLIFTSPPGSGIYNTYDRKEDMTVEITMRASSGTAVSDTITARVMLEYGINVIRVASDTFVGQEYTDLYDAVDVTNQIYENRNITISDVGRYHIPDADAGSYGIINSESECRDMWQDWGVTGTNRIDAFICHDFSGTRFDGLAGAIPGPTSHSGRNSGVAADKTGFVDASGVRRLSVAYLGMLIGHELGHYLGLQHVSEADNLMLSNSGTNDTTLNYDQYRIMLRHGWMFVH